MKRATTFALIALAAMTFARQASASTIVTAFSENFESYNVNTAAASIGWTQPAGSGSIANWTVQDPAGLSLAGNASSRYLDDTSANTDTQLIHALSTTAGLAAATSITFDVLLAPRNTGSHVQRMIFGARTDGGTVGSTFGVDAGANTTTAPFVIGSTDSATLASADHWYELQLQITVDPADYTTATGSLSYKDLTASQTSFTAVSDLQNITLGFNNTNNNPSQWTNFWLRGGFRQAVDNLSLSYVVPVPAALPAGLALLGSLAYRRRR